MLNNFRIGAVLLMGGEGRRFGNDLPKQFHRLAGKPIFIHTLEVFLQTEWIDEIVLVCHPDWISFVQSTIEKKVRIVTAGATRQESSFQGLKGFEIPPHIVLIHDAVRPFVTSIILEDNAKGALQWGAVDTCIPSADTLVHAPEGQIIHKIPLRDHFLRGQTPQSFKYDLILEAHEDAVKQGIANASDDCRLVLHLGKTVGVVKGDEHNIKITTELDLFLAEQLFRLRKKTAPNVAGSIKGKYFAVLGGSGGIGSAVCQLLEKEGAKTISLSRRTGVDLTKSLSIVKAFKEIGEIDGLINCAGALLVKPLELHSILEIEMLLQVNFTGLVIACQQAKIRKGGHIINLASSSFTRGRKNYGVYSSSKAAVINFTQALAEEKPDLRIHAVIPQRTKTPMRSTNFPGEDETSLLDPKEVAVTILHLLKDPFGTGSLVEVKKT
jgi:2-C-methyl-D-erythritol 4-phosphate cytidylyltransferase